MLYIINANMVSKYDEENNTKSDFKLDKKILNEISNERNGKILYLTLNIKSLGKKNINENLYSFLTENYDIEEMESIGLINKKDKATKSTYAHIIDNKDLFEILRKKRKNLKFLSFVDFIETIFKDNKVLKNTGIYNFPHSFSLIHVLKFNNRFYLNFNLYYDKDEEEIKISALEITETEEESLEFIQTAYNNTISLEEYIPLLITNIDIAGKSINEKEEISSYFKKENLLDTISADIDHKSNKNIINKLDNFIINISTPLNTSNLKQAITDYIDPVKFVKAENKKSTIKLAILGMVGFAFFGASYYIQNYLTAAIQEEQQSQIDDLNAKLDDLKNRYYKLEAELLPYKVLKEEYKKEKKILLVPYLQTYFQHFNLKLKSIYVAKIPSSNKYKLYVLVNGFLPNKLLDKLKGIGLVAFDILPKSNVINSGFNYVFEFDIDKFNEIINKYHLIY